MKLSRRMKRVLRRERELYLRKRGIKPPKTKTGGRRALARKAKALQARALG